MLNTPDRTVIRVAAGALASGTDPQTVRQFLEYVLELHGKYEAERVEIQTAADAFYAELDRAEINHQTS